MERFKTLKDHVYDYIAEQIRDGALLPDKRVNENVICEELNISRTPVREALIQLAAEGVLENRARKGFVIKAMSHTDIKEIYAVIGVLDGYAAKLSCDNLTEQDYADMAFYIDAMELAINSGNYEMYYKQQTTFHQLYINKCGNNTLIDTIAKTKNKLLKKTYIDDDDQTLKEVFAKTNNEHRKILELFKAKDTETLFHYIADTHWMPDYATYDMIV